MGVVSVIFMGFEDYLKAYRAQVEVRRALFDRAFKREDYVEAQEVLDGLYQLVFEYHQHLGSMLLNVKNKLKVQDDFRTLEVLNGLEASLDESVRQNAVILEGLLKIEIPSGDSD
jgi:hypothetical protein